MTATTSGTATFNLDVEEIIDEALGKLGGEHVSGIELKKTRRTLNLLIIELQNKGVPISAFDFISVSAVQGQTEYPLSEDVTDVYELNLKRAGTETPLLKYGLQEFHQIPTKADSSRPSTYTVERNTNNLVLKIWPTSDNSTDTFELMVEKKVEDITASYQKVDLPYYYLPVLVYGLAYHRSLHRQGVPQDVRGEIRAVYQDLLKATQNEDDEKVSMIIRPGGISGRN